MSSTNNAQYQLETIAHNYARALMDASRETYGEDVEKASRQAKAELVAALQSFLADLPAPAGLVLPKVELVGMKDGKETSLGEVPMPPTMKARELLREQGFTDLDDEMSHDACALWACESLIEYCHAYYTEEATPTHFAALASCGEGVLFANEVDARWSATGRGAGSDGFGVPTIGDAFRDTYEGEKFRLVRVQILEEVKI